ncbi:MAG: L-threonylcarbamoyladenylate synthase [Chitinivibrionales bacterium]|nr:L-threonylcarbamoyladenylate synthase [Chitinivibrionales bacterium]
MTATVAQPSRITLATLVTGYYAVKRCKEIAQRINDGAVFIYPTETIYGLGAAATNIDSGNRIRGIKNKHLQDPLILIAGKREAFNCLPLVFPKIANLLADKFWPGNLTLVLPTTDGRDPVGIRLSPHPFLKALNAFLDVPIYSTSANMHDADYINDPAVIFKTFRSSIDFMIDGGVLKTSAPSTVVKISTDNQCTIIREGAIAKAEIEKVINS